MKNVFIKTALIGLFYSSVFGADNLPATLKNGLNELYNLRYESAICVADSVIKKHPEHPSGYLLKSLIYFYQIGLGKREKRLKDLFLECNHQALDIAKRHDNKTERMFFRAAALSNIALFYGMESDWLNAIRFGLQARSEHEKVVKTDPTFYDSYICLGLFNYYADTLPKILNIFTYFLGIKGDGPLGIDQLKLTYEKGIYLNVEAATFLNTFYMERGNFEDALEISNRLSADYPGNPFFKLDKAKTYYELGKYSIAKKIFKNIVEDTTRFEENAVFFSFYYLGRINMIYNHHEQAILDFKKVIQLGEKSDLIQLYDGWLVGDGYYFTGECFEFLDRPDSARHYFKLAQDAKYVSKGIEEASKNRLRYLRTDYERKVQQLSNFITRGEYEQGYTLLQTYWDSTNTNQEASKFKSYIFYNLGKAQFEIGNINKAIDLFTVVLQEKDEAKSFDWILPTATLYLAKCHNKTGDLEKVRTLLIQATEYKNYHNENRLRFLIKEFEKSLD